MHASNHPTRAIIGAVNAESLSVRAIGTSIVFLADVAVAWPRSIGRRTRR
jgi:hypothetical protein